MNEVNEIICGNHLDVLKKYPDDCFDMFLTSPPYDNLRDYKGYDFQFEPLAHELYRTLKPGGVGVWVVNDATIDGSETLTSFRQAIYFKDVVGFNVHDTMIFHKLNPCPQIGNRFQPSFEFMFVLSKNAATTFNPTKIPCVIAVNDWATTGSSYRKGKTSRLIKSDKRKVNNEKYPINILSYAIGGKSTIDKISFNHPASFPEELAKDQILTWSNPGDIVLDPMCGSGTTCKMAVKHGRQYVGIDIADEYCEIARNRIDKFTQQTDMFGATGYNNALHATPTARQGLS